MPHHTPLIGMLVGGLCLAFVFGMLAQRLRLSPLFGYLVAGIVAGPFTPGFVADAAIAQQLSEIGVILLMFGVGLHFSIGELWSVRKIVIPGALFQVVLVSSLGTLFAWLAGWNWGSGLIFGICLSVASTVVLLRALEERRLLETHRGRVAIGWLIVEDLLMVLVLVMLPPLAGVLGGESVGNSGSAGELITTLAWTVGKVTVFIVLMLVIGRRVIPWILERTASVGSRELFTLSVLAIALGVAYVSAVVFEVSFALGAFLAGVMLNESKLSHEAASDSLPMRDAFAVLFFVSVGMLFDPRIIVEQPLAILGTFLIIVLGNSLAGFIVTRMYREPLQTQLTLAIGLSQIGEFSFILAALGVSLGLLSEDARNLILAAALLSIIVNPMLFVLLDRWSRRHEAEIHDAAERSLSDAEDDILPDRAAIPAGSHIILVGYGKVGSRVARSLHEHGMPLVLIDSDREKCIEARKLGIPCIFGNAVSTEVLSDANLGSARAMLVAISQALQAGPIIKLAREANPGLAILARAHSDEEVVYLHKAGADATIMGESEIARSMCESVESLIRLAQRLESVNLPSTEGSSHDKDPQAA